MPLIQYKDVLIYFERRGTNYKSEGYLLSMQEAERKTPCESWDILEIPCDLTWRQESRQVWNLGSSDIQEVFICDTIRDTTDH